MSRRRIKKTIKACLAIGLALFAAEGFLRLTTTRELVYDTWFTPGIHQPDAQFGFVFTPNYRGQMRHRDKVWNVPLELDTHGFRQLSTNAASAPTTHHVALVGGASMMMCYGLPDDSTIAQQVTEASTHSLAVRTVAWPGFDSHRSWHVYRNKLRQIDRPQLVVLCVYAKSLPDFAVLPEDMGSLPTAHGAQQKLRFSHGIVVPPRGRLAEQFHAEYEDSFLLCKAIGLADRCWDKVAPRRPGVSTTAHVAVDAPDPIETGRQRFVEFLQHVQTELAADGTSLLLAFLPVQDAQPDCYAALCEAVPDSIRYVDLHHELGAAFRPEGYIADGHYGATQAELIGQALAEQVDRELQGRLLAALERYRENNR